MTKADDDRIHALGCLLVSTERPLKERFRALFTLRNLGGREAVEAIGGAFGDTSALLKHEAAYCLGQMQDPSALPILAGVLRDLEQEPIVRHEAAEAMGAVGSDDKGVIEALTEFSRDPSAEVSDTCRLALARLDWMRESAGSDTPVLSSNPYRSVDPAPPALKEGGVAGWTRSLTDAALPLFDRYRAMFALRNEGSDEAIKALCSGFASDNALFRHEIAYVLGQMQSELSKDALMERLRDVEEHAMVRHECAEALGALASDDVNKALKAYLDEKEPRVVRESCVIALDMCDYNQSDEFQYANGLSVV